MAAWLKANACLWDDFVVIGYEPGLGGAATELRVVQRGEDGVLH
ncbi:hypothetical protein FHS85_005285 [Rhodoligotrophos appendicifer]|nr:hypothetical protein [Rhodoligotrophos appendicifer]